MKLWLDTEFNSHGGELISIGLVDEIGNEFYEATHISSDLHPWVQANVMPVLNIDPISKNVLRIALEEWLVKYPKIHVIADWPADVAYFCNLLLSDADPGTRISTPPLTFEVRRDIDSSGSLCLHNAIADARALRLAYLAVAA